MHSLEYTISEIGQNTRDAVNGLRADMQNLRSDVNLKFAVLIGVNTLTFAALALMIALRT